MKVVLVNGPPKSGKSTLAMALGEMLAEGRARVLVTPLASVLKGATHGFYAGLTGNTVIPKWNYFEETKEEADDFFLGKTPRQAYIDMHEEVFTPMFGNDFIARRKAQVLAENAGKFDVAIVPDVGGIHQVEPFRPLFGECILLRLSRQGCTWDNRRPIESAPGHVVLDYANDGTLEELKHWARTSVLEAIHVAR